MKYKEGDIVKVVNNTKGSNSARALLGSLCKITKGDGLIHAVRLSEDLSGGGTWCSEIRHATTEEIKEYNKLNGKEMTELEEIEKMYESTVATQTTIPTLSAYDIGMSPKGYVPTYVDGVVYSNWSGHQALSGGNDRGGEYEGVFPIQRKRREMDFNSSKYNKLRQ